MEKTIKKRVARRSFVEPRFLVPVGIAPSEARAAENCVQAERNILNRFFNLLPPSFLPLSLPPPSLGQEIVGKDVAAAQAADGVAKVPDPSKQSKCIRGGRRSSELQPPLSPKLEPQYVAYLEHNQQGQLRGWRCCGPPTAPFQLARKVPANERLCKGPSPHCSIARY